MVMMIECSRLLMGAPIRWIFSTPNTGFRTGRIAERKGPTTRRTKRDNLTLWRNGLSFPGTINRPVNNQQAVNNQGP
jgi:hypothetical protein